jgi:hypothetical protein
MEQAQMQECTVRISPGEAISPHLTDGAVICLEPGVHTGGLTLGANVVLRGEPGAILDGQGRDPVIQILAHEKKITLEGLILRGGYGESGGGLYLDGFSMVTVDNCSFEGNLSMEGGGPGLVATGGLLSLKNTRFAAEDDLIFDILAQVTMTNCSIAGDLRISDGAKVKASDSTIAGVLTLRGTTSRSPTVELSHCTIGKIDNSPDLPATLTVLD